MVDWIFKVVSDVIGNAEKLAGLSVTGVWAFFTLVLIAYIVYDMKLKKQASDSAWDARLEEAKADGLIAAALEKMSNEIKELRYRIKCDGDT